MTRRLLSLLQYETRIHAGAYFHLQTDWFAIDEEIQTIIIDQSNVYSKILSIYPKGFFMYLEQDADGAIYRTNYPLYLTEGADTYQVDWDFEHVEE